jgi:DNA-binding CsgD family transcriptional regulator
MSREPSSAHHVPGLSDLGSRLTRRLGANRAREVADAGGALDLNDAAAYAQRQIAVARRSPIPTAHQARPAGLSRREVEVLRLVADGRSAREISAQLFISTRTAEHHIQHVYTKIGVSGRAAATRWAIEHAVVDAN